VKLFSTISVFLRRTEVSSLAPIAAVSFLWSKAEQKDLAESGTCLSIKFKGFASKNQCQLLIWLDKLVHFSN